MKKVLFLLCLLLLLPTLVLSWGEEENVGTITGRLMLKNGEPMSGAVIFLFNAATGPAPSLGKYWRVPDIVAETDENGNFSVTVAAGKYYLSSTMRKSEAGLLGPPNTGDYIYPSFEQSIRSRQVAYRIKKWETTNIGTIKGGVLFDREKHMYRGTVTAIEGRISHTDGKPAEHAIIFAFDNAEMNGNPRYASDPSGKDGKYILRVGKPGIYYLRVRGVYGGGQPTTGSLMGGGAPGGVRALADKTVKGVDITVDTFTSRGDPVK